MPKCLLNSLRGYRSRKYVSGNEYNPFVMTTRSGLSIRTKPRTKLNSNKLASSPSPMTDPPPPVTKRKTLPPKHRSLSHLSFVTRFYICRRLPELDLAGVAPRDYANWREELLALREPKEEDGISPVFSLSQGDVTSDVVLGTVSDDNTDLYIEELESPAEFKFSAQKLDPGGISFECPKILFTSCLRKVSDSPNASSKNPTVLYSLNQVPNTPSADQTDFTDDLEEDFSQSTHTSSARDDEELDLCVSDDSTDDYDLICKECNVEFQTTQDYKTHMWIHKKDRNACPVCGKAFTRSWLLKGHLRTHTGERPFRCSHPDCDKAFADKSNLRSHMLIHTTQNKSYICPKCSRAFAQKRYLHKHMLEVCRLI